jgi:hypothetical protein
VSRDGKELFCRREILTGSRTNSAETCLTKAQLALQVERNQDALRDLQDLPGRQWAPSSGVMIDATTIR